VTAPTSEEALRIALHELRIELAIISRRVAAVSGLNHSDLDVLDVLNLEGLQSPTALARRLGIHAATMTGVLTRLERSGWVVRRPHAVDRRTVEIESAGFDRLTEVFRAADKRVDDVSARLTPADRKVVLDYLRDVGVAIREASAAINPA
jgi:DNA-binding MarR family transcriptional regulator